MTPREIVKATLEFRNTDTRVPRSLSILPWAEMNHPEELARLYKEYPSDMVSAPNILKKKPVVKGNAVEIGSYTDEWGCTFTNIQRGIQGEIKEPLVQDDDWNDVDKVYIPVEYLDFDMDQANAFCRSTDYFVSGNSHPRPFERLQWIRGTENFFMDLMDPPANMLKFMQKMHTFYCDWVEKWCKTEIDGIFFLDDWGSQRSLLISPQLWDEMFRPMYQDYIDIAKRHGKKTFMHSDGYTVDLFPRLIEMGLDAFNSQIFCMGVDKLESFKGQISFWGEIDRQHLLPHGTKAEIQNVVKEIYERLWSNGGCFAQCEFGPAAKPENVFTVYETWNSLRG